MPKVNEMFPSKYLSAADLGGQDLIVTIKDVMSEYITDQEADEEVEKFIVLFEENPKGLMLNKTNTGTIAALYGNDTDNWIGERVTLFPTQVQYMKKMVDAIRVRTQVPRVAKTKANGNGAAKPSKATKAAAPTATTDPTPTDGANESDIPF